MWCNKSTAPRSALQTIFLANLKALPTCCSNFQALFGLMNTNDSFPIRENLRFCRTLYVSCQKTTPIKARQDPVDLLEKKGIKGLIEDGYEKRFRCWAAVAVQHLALSSMIVHGNTSGTMSLHFYRDPKAMILFWGKMMTAGMARQKSSQYSSHLEGRKQSWSSSSTMPRPPNLSTFKRDLDQCLRGLDMY